MWVGLTTTSLTAYITYSTPFLFRTLITGGEPTPTGYVLLLLPLAFAVLLFIRISRFPYYLLVSMFLLYSMLMGFSQCILFISYADMSIYFTYLVVSLMFSLAGIIGYFTGSDMMQKISFVIIGFSLIVIIATLNVFTMNSSAVAFISTACVIAFCSISVWNVRRLKKLVRKARGSRQLREKLGIMGAFILYLNFINPYLFTKKIFRL
jgi:FtsH-binding integral membrane protein